MMPAASRQSVVVRFWRAVALLLGLAALVPGALAEEPRHNITAYMVHASDAEAPPVQAIEAPPEGFQRVQERLQAGFPARHHLLLGRHTAPVNPRYTTWLKPSPQFPLQVENTGYTEDGGLAVYWILWQKEQLPTKDRELVKSSTILKEGSPLIIAGPRWRGGRLIFVVVLEDR